MAGPIITLTTDFGGGSPYVAEMKGAILSINPATVIVDVTHDIPPQDVRQAALVLEQIAGSFPPGTIHVGVVDPGVGSARRIVCLVLGGQYFVGPDNGLASRLARRSPPSTMVSVENAEYWRPVVSRTFHGRDVMGPVAAHLSLGVEPESFGPRVESLVQLDWPEARILPNQIEGEVVSVDSFGNLVTNITDEMLAAARDAKEVIVRCDEHETVGIFSTYSDQPPMTLIALVGSSGRLELAIVNDSAKAMLGVNEGERVTVHW